MYASQLSANSKVVYLDIDKILSSSLAGKSIKIFLDKEVEKNSIFFKTKEKELKDKEKSIISQKNIIKEDEYKIKIENFKKEVSDYKKKINESNTNLAKQRVQLTNKLITEINPILANYSNENSISLIIQKKIL